jgi:prolyl 4-hydroxylase
MVRYEKTERFDLHYDWYDSPQLVKDGTGRYFNRIASFFVFLEDECEGGETWFPYIEGASEQEAKWKNHEDGGLAFKPRSGNGIFWINLFANGTGDKRTMVRLPHQYLSWLGAALL